MLQITLQIRERDRPVRDSVHEVKSLLVGRGPGAGVKLEDPDVADIHAALKVNAAGALTLIDLGGGSGTSLNGTPVRDPVSVREGDAFQLGQTKITITRLVESEDPELMPTALAEVSHLKRRSESASLATPVLSGPLAGSGLLKSDERRLRLPFSDDARPSPEEHVFEASVYWGDVCLDSVRVREARAVTVGGRVRGRWWRPGGFDLEVDAELPPGGFTLAVVGKREAVVTVPEDSPSGMRSRDGSVARDLEEVPSNPGFAAKGYRLRVGERILFRVGQLTFVLQFVKGRVALGPGKAFDLRFPCVAVISALLHVLFVMTALFTPKPDLKSPDRVLKHQGRFAQFVRKEPERQKARARRVLAGAKEGARHQGEEGHVGKKKKRLRDAAPSKPGARRVDPKKRERDRKIAMNSGLLALLRGKGARGSATSNILGPGGLGTGINEAMGGLRGVAMGDAEGAQGLGTRGTKKGGGGRSLGIGGLGTRGRGPGRGGEGSISLGGRGKSKTRIVPGKRIVKGSLSSAEIDRVIRRAFPRFKFCYEKELKVKNRLTGKVSVNFTIAPTGRVARARVEETTMGAPTVERCVTGVMRSLRFPKPRGGGIVVVTYPFVFAST